MRQCGSCVVNRLDYHYGNARNNGYSHELAEQIARFMTDAERKPRQLPVVQTSMAVVPVATAYHPAVNGMCWRLVTEILDRHTGEVVGRYGDLP